MLMTTPVTLRGSNAGSSTPAGTRVLTVSPSERSWKRPDAGAAATRAHMRRPRAPQAHDQCIARAADDRGQQAVVGGQEIVSAGVHGENVARGADARIDYGDVHSCRREVAEGVGHPEA